ncbi:MULTISPECIES: ABC transporter ATP-binding protein [Collinsella]|uniref:ABC transporter ATP-binding protein n=1 Tax=Collinsella ihumii TaxID=1720204 RepID=A0ABT7XE41_9ACTN|nr:MULTISPECIES: ABC transporter ATP-binding protein [Collinsella]MBM6777502.1 ABC transporter ATP-binding protein [Collinsella tanakaei]MBM6905333.1 ABC transporter ATP-binding protein [Collinsella tanakaei]MDN0055321.1 ABC transporter ATP-binding protein [Collinsella ihumii]MDN0063664.1 ABC transporter ATP-binding protein [Collinsella ihumii]OUO61797.1 ABC transporter ATP-binding protein [Collinsella sp. An271]
MAEPLLEVKDLRTEFKRGKKDWITAVNGVSFSVNAGEIVGLVGESGCGKSVTSMSVMRLHNKLSTRISGDIVFGGKHILELSEAEMQSIRGNEISMIFQEPMSALDPIMRIENQLIEAISLHNKELSKDELHKRCVSALKLVGIPEPEMTLRNYPHELSGGMCQRVMIAMAMSCEPKLLIADEPTTALDVTIQAQILALMEDIRNKRNTGILMITHDLGVVAETCSRVIVMYAGNIVEEAPVKELFSNPQHPYTQGLIESVPKLGRRVHRLPSIPGSVPDLAAMPSGCRFAPRCKYAQASCSEALPKLVKVAENHYAACPFHTNARKEA